jgi:glucose-6-phosphate isomerase
MIQIDFQNVLSGAIGPRNGLEKRFLEGLLKKGQPLVKKVLDSANRSGYGFLGLPKDLVILREIEAFMKKRAIKWQNIVVLGIGGSALGGIALQESLLGNWHNLSGKPRLFFLDNIDPDFVSGLFSSIDLEKTLFIVVSKSGGTTEPMALYSVAQKELSSRFPKDWQKRFLFVTDPKEGLLREIGNKEKVKMFSIPTKVGGRFSVLTAAALLPAALAGIDIQKLQYGARQMLDYIRRAKGSDNPALLLACLQHHFDAKKGKPMVVMMPYGNRLFRIADWYRQLLAESIGKNPKTGPTPINALGTTDQHSQLQLYNEGPNDKWFIFMEALRPGIDQKLGKNLPKELGFLNGKGLDEILKASLQGTSESLAKNGRPNITLKLDQIDEETIGGLFMLFEFQVALLGLLYKVNAFDQPGVEQSKIITKKILSGKK